MYQPHPPIQPAPAQTEVFTPLITLSQIIGILRRQWPLILGTAAVFVVLILLYCLTATPRYTALARILMDTRQSQVLETQTPSGNTVVDTGLVDSQVELLTSDDLLASIIRKMNLVDDPEIRSQFGGLIPTIMSYLPLSSDSGPPSEEQRVQKVVELMQRNLKVARVGTTYVLAISYTALSAEKAAQLANAIANSYILSGLEVKYDSTRRASEWLLARSAELRDETTRADRAVQSFKAQHGIVGTSRGLMSEQELTDVNSQLVQARAATAEVKARLDRVEAITDKDVVQSTVSEALTNSVITRLRAQYLDIGAQYANWVRRYGPNHEASQGLQNRMNELRKSIQDEVQRISDATRSDYEIARAREQALQTNVDTLVRQNNSSGQTQVELRNLESAADTSRTLYNSFLEKLQQATQRETFPITDSRIITTATPPDRKSSPKTLLLLGAGLMGGLLVGSGAAFAREMLSDVFRAPADVEENLGIECLGVLPTIRALGGSLESSKLTRYVVDNPFSRYCETLRKVKVSIDFMQQNRESRVIGIVSSLPKEGKTTVAANLAHLTAMMGYRTLVIDGDLHTCTLTRILAPGASIGLLEAMANPEHLAQCVTRLDGSQVDFLPAVAPNRMINSADLISSADMARLLEIVRGHYQYVFIDFAPLLPVADVQASSHLIDGFIYVIEWGKTRRAAVAEAITGAGQVQEKLVGAVLNSADTKTLKTIESYKGRHHNSYYLERT